MKILITDTSDIIKGNLKGNNIDLYEADKAYIKRKDGKYLCIKNRLGAIGKAYTKDELFLEEL